MPDPPPRPARASPCAAPASPSRRSLARSAGTAAASVVPHLKFEGASFELSLVGKLDKEARRLRHQPFFAFEQVDGESFAELLRASPRLAWDQARAIVAEIAACLAIAHSAGVVHGDLKPGNITLQRGALGHFTVRLLDWGMSSRGIEREENTRADIGLAVDYQAPEQIRGELPLPASDLYALGVLLFEALVGARPFKGPPNLVAMHHVRTPAPSPRALLPNLAPEADEIIGQLLQKDPHRRLSRASTLHERLRDEDLATQVYVRQTLTVTPPSPPSPPPGRQTAQEPTTGTQVIDPAALARVRERDDNTQILSVHAPPASASPHQEDLTLVVQAAHSPFLLDTNPSARPPPSEPTSVHQDPGATVIVNSGALAAEPSSTAGQVQRAPKIPRLTLPEQLSLRWLAEHKFIVLNSALVLVILTSLVIVLMRR
jgi:serine/threonine protein kinase